jgi:hypothetical protein
MSVTGKKVKYRTLYMEATRKAYNYCKLSSELQSSSLNGPYVPIK